MLKDDITNQILFEMKCKLTNEQFTDLKNSLTKVLYGIELVKEITELTICDNDNEKYLLKFSTVLRIEQKASSTIYHYVRSSKNFLDFANKNFRDISTDDINFYFATLMTNNHAMSSTSLDNQRKFIKGFFNWLAENDYISKNPFNRIKPIKRTEKMKEILSEQEVEMIRDECKNNKRNIALIDFLLSTGVRISECVALNLNDINFNTGEVNIYGKKTRTWRKVYLDAKALKHLTDYITDRNIISQAVFISDRKPNNRLSKESIQRITKENATNSGINKRCTVHIFRKTLASRLYSKGMSAQKIAMLLGNSTAVSEKYYILISSDDLRNEYLKCVA